MSKTYNENMNFAGGLSVGNFAHGIVVVSPSPGEVVTVDVGGLNMEGEGQLYPQAQVYTQHPWYSCSNALVYTPVTDPVAVNLGSTDGTAFRSCIRRTNSSETNIGWCVWKGIDA